MDVPADLPGTVLSVTNVASITYDGALGPDPNPANNTAEATTPCLTE